MKYTTHFKTLALLISLIVATKAAKTDSKNAKIGSKSGARKGKELMKRINRRLKKEKKEKKKKRNKAMTDVQMARHIMEIDDETICPIYAIQHNCKYLHDPFSSKPEPDFPPPNAVEAGKEGGSIACDLMDWRANETVGYSRHSCTSMGGYHFDCKMSYIDRNTQGYMLAEGPWFLGDQIGDIPVDPSQMEMILLGGNSVFFAVQGTATLVSVFDDGIDFVVVGKMVGYDEAWCAGAWEGLIDALDTEE